MESGVTYSFKPKARSNTKALSICIVSFPLSTSLMNFTLVPGDVILTGTPHGVGAFRDPSIYMKDSDEIVVEIEGLGSLKNVCQVI